MGELESVSSTHPVFIVIMRNSRGKLFVYIAVLGVLCFIVFLLSTTHSSLKEMEGINEKCQQQRDSLSAQLQVVYEHKNRLEKSLQQEKTDHRHTKETNEKQLNELEIKLQELKDKGQKLETEITHLKTTYSELEEDKTQIENALKEQIKTLQSQKNLEIEKLQAHISELLAEKDKLEISNSNYIKKIEQHASEVTLCQLQHQQTKAELNICESNLRANNKVTVDIHEPAEVNTSVKSSKDGNLKTENNVQNQDKKVTQESETKSVNITKEKPVVLEKPHVLSANNLGDGVLPKPLEEKQEDSPKNVSPSEVAEVSEKKVAKLHVLDHVEEKYVDSKIDLVNGELKSNKLEPDAHQKAYHSQQKEQENYPQMLPPHNFDNMGDKDDHAAERGEYGPQYANPDIKQQVELPEFSPRHNGKWKNVIPPPRQANSDNAAAQMQDMMNKSPGDVNNADVQSALRVPPQDFGPIDNKIQEFKNAGAFVHRGADVHNVIDDKNYEEDN
ncbi:Golgi integral membrane protein 4, partial [Stegodyphus mimosarum]